MATKRKVENLDEKPSKRFQPELFDSEDEEDMCKAADDAEMWSGDEDWEELMSEAVDNYEQSFPKQTLQNDQFGHGQQQGINAQPLNYQPRVDSDQQRRNADPPQVNNDQPL